MDVSVVIVNYKTGRLVEQCVSSLIKFTKNQTYEVIIVDNNSDDEYLKNTHYTDENIKLIYSNENLGFGRANNLGAKSAKGKYILFLNPDTYLLNDVIDEFYQFASKNLEFGALGGNLYDAELMPNISYELYLPGHNLVQEFKKILPIRSKKELFNNTTMPKKVGYVSGACMFMNLEIFQDIGGFDSDFFMYYEETELCARLTEKKKDIISIPSARVVHLEGQAVKISDNKQKLMNSSKSIYYNKTLPRYKISLNKIVDKIEVIKIIIIRRFR